MSHVLWLFLIEVISLAMTWIFIIELNDCFSQPANIEEMIHRSVLAKMMPPEDKAHR